MCTSQGILHLGLKIRSHSLREKYLKLLTSWCTSIHNEEFLISTYLSMESWKMLPRLVILMTLWWWHFLAMLGTTQKASRNCALFELCGKVRPPQSLASFENKVVAARQAGRRPFAAAIGGADTPKFRKQSYTFCNVEKLRRNSLVLQFQLKLLNISHQDIDAKVDDWWRVFKREHNYKIILTKFDKINFQKFLAPDNDAKNKSSVGTFNYSWRDRISLFFSYPKGAW